MGSKFATSLKWGNSMFTIKDLYVFRSMASIKSHRKDELGAVFITRELIRFIRGVLEPHMRCRQTFALCSLGLLPLSESLEINKGCCESLLLTIMKRFYCVGEDLFQNNNAFLSILGFCLQGWLNQVLGQYVMERLYFVGQQMTTYQVKIYRMLYFSSKKLLYHYF